MTFTGFSQLAGYVFLLRHFLQEKLHSLRQFVLAPSPGFSEMPAVLSPPPVC